MEIKHSTPEDIESIFKLYDQATAYQKTVTKKSWRGFKLAQVLNEINEGRHFIIWEGEDVACTFLITLDDEIIWKGKENDEAIYLHRIATNPVYRGKSYVQKIVAWAKTYAAENGQEFIRLDTHSGNEKINTYYKSCGFEYKGISHIEWTDDLPEHYKEGSFSLFEIVL